MTNNPTIDGVSRELLRKQFEEKNEHRGWFVAGGISEIDTPEGFVYSDLTTDMCWTCYFEANAALQSTIARLEARITQLESEKELMLRGAEVYKERIVELESGRGEPIYEIEYLGEGGGGWVETDKHQFDVTSKLKNFRTRIVFTAPPAPVAVVPDGWKLVPVEPTELMIRRGDQNYSWSVAKIYKAMIEDAPACLDATAALNNKPSTEVKP